MKVGDTRVRFCRDTQTKVVQEWTGREWLCLHNDTVEEDRKEANKYEQDIKITTG